MARIARWVIIIFINTLITIFTAIFSALYASTQVIFLLTTLLVIRLRVRARTGWLRELLLYTPHWMFSISRPNHSLNNVIRGRNVAAWLFSSTAVWTAWGGGSVNKPQYISYWVWNTYVTDTKYDDTIVVKHSVDVDI